MVKEHLLRAFGIMIALSLLSTVSPALGAAPTPKLSVLKLKFSSPVVPSATISEVQKWWAEEVAKRSGGRIEWEFFWGGSLTRVGEEVEAVETGLADAAHVCFPCNVGKLPLSNWNFAVPFAPGDPKAILEATKRLFNEVPQLKAELERYNQKILFPVLVDTYNLTSKRPIVKFEDFRGIKIASIGAYHPRILNTAGATAIAMPVPERYTALQTGVIDAEFLPWDLSFSYRYQDINKHATWIDMGAVTPVVVSVNQQTWKRLPSNLQQLMLTVAEEAAEYQVKLILTRREEAIVGFKAAGVMIHDMPFEEKVKWANALADLPGEWIREVEGKRLAGRQVMVRYLESLEETGHKFPRKWAADYR